MELNHQIAVIQPVFRLRIQRGKVFLRLTFTWHHTDVVPAHQCIQSGHARQRRFWRDQPELGFTAQRILHIGFDADANLDFIQILTEPDILDRAHFNALEAHGCSPGDNAVGGLEVNRNGITAIFVTRPDKPARYHQCDNRE